ncbi:94K-C [Samia ricini nucleopolyhedrovirus]|nr:94K-C [Samia ricini nucleopolyhedrovirus]BBD51389.1 94K-C [Samia ricini nucleopolyhedrovirus]
MITHVDLWDGAQGGMSRFKQQLDFPLLFARNENLKLCIDYCYNLESLQQLMQHGPRLSPRTRRPFTGALVPDPLFDAYNDYVVASSFFAGKKAPYNAGLMYYLLYKLIAAAEFIEPCVKDRFRAYALHRIRATQCFMALSNLPMDPPLQVALPAAVWYVAEISTLLFAADHQHFAKERLRQYAGFADDLLTILQWCGLEDVNAARVRQRAHCLSLVNKFKRMTKPNAARWVLERAFEVRDGFCVNNLVNAQRLSDLKYLSVNPAGLIDDEALAAAPVPFDKYAVMYNHICDFEAEVVAATMRPPFILGAERTFYDALLERARTVRLDEQLNVVLEPCRTLAFDKFVSINKLYIRCVDDVQQFPSKEQFTEYVQLVKSEQNGRVAVFPQNIAQNIAAVHAVYAQKTVNMSVQQFLVLANKSVNRRERIKMEIQDSSDESADKLIADAEKRVGLKRV